MNILAKRILIALVITAFAFTSLTACTQDASGSDTDNSANEGSEKQFDKLESELKVFFEEVYSAFNEQRFEDYIGYLNITDETLKANMLNSFNSGVQYHKTTCVLEALDAKEFEDGLINAALSLITTTELLNSDNDTKPVKVREIIYYNLEKSGDSFTVKNYTAGGSQMVADEAAQ